MLEVVEAISDVGTKSGVLRVCVIGVEVCWGLRIFRGNVARGMESYRVRGSECDRVGLGSFQIACQAGALRFPSFLVFPCDGGLKHAFRVVLHSILFTRRHGSSQPLEIWSCSDEMQGFLAFETERAHLHMLFMCFCL